MNCLFVVYHETAPVDKGGFLAPLGVSGNPDEGLFDRYGIV